MIFTDIQWHMGTAKAATYTEMMMVSGMRLVLANGRSHRGGLSVFGRWASTAAGGSSVKQGALTEGLCGDSKLTGRQGE